MTPLELQSPAVLRVRTSRSGQASRSGRRAVLLTALLVLALLPGAGRAGEDVVARRHVSAPPDVVWAQLTDFDSWAAMFPAIESVDRERLDERHERLRTANRVAGYTLRYTLLTTADPAAHRLECHLDPSEPGDIEQLDSTWQITPAANGGSRVELRVLSRSGHDVPDFVERIWAKHSARESVDGLVDALARHPRVARRD